ncbi:MAG: hypothetical protein QF464_23710, partial [Myxococcota bacterium]|nr:hypothetical protein [Myxococcota bacterium]
MMTRHLLRSSPLALSAIWFVGLSACSDAASEGPGDTAPGDSTLVIDGGSNTDAGVAPSSTDTSVGIVSDTDIPVTDGEAPPEDASSTPPDTTPAVDAADVAVAEDVEAPGADTTSPGLSDALTPEDTAAPSADIDPPITEDV